MPEITPELLERISRDVYRRSLDSDRDRAKFDELPDEKKDMRARAYAPLVRATMLALGYTAPARQPKAAAAADDWME